MIRHTLTNTFKLALVNGIHQPEDRYHLALYVGGADLSELTEVYTTAGEVRESPGYNAGGILLGGRQAALDGAIAYVTWADPVWPRATIRARGGLIYNLTRGNRAVAVMDLGQDYVSTNGNFVIELPLFGPTTALIAVK